MGASGPFPLRALRGSLAADLHGFGMAYFTASDGARIAYEDQGTGMAVLCLAGLTRTMGDFAYALPALAGGRVIRMDYRGRGASDWTGAASYSVPHEAKDALGLCLNDVGPEIHRPGLERIFDYVGRNPATKTHEALAERLPRTMPGFANVPESRWLQEARLHYVQTEDGLRITYDPALRAAFLAAFDGPAVDLWPLYDALAGLPVALIRGANSDLLSEACADEMRRRRPDLIFAEVPDRAHIPFLDEPESVAVIHAFLEACHGVA